MKKGRRLVEIEAEMEAEHELIVAYLADVKEEERREKVEYYTHLGEVPWGVSLPIEEENR